MSFIQDKFINTSRNLLICLFSLFFILLATGSCNDEGGSGNGDDRSLIIELLTKSEPDECFCGIGAEDNGPISNSITGDCSDLTPEEPLTACKPKRNYSYVWGLTKAGRQLWIGTLQNTLCVGGAGFNPIRPPMPELRDNSVCEFQESHVAPLKPLPILGDLRTPKIVVYDTKTGLTQEISVDNCEGGNGLLEETLGLRQAGSFKKGDFAVVILAGPSLFGDINMFAFDPGTHVCLAARNFPQYNDARNNMIVVDGVLYTTVGKSIDDENPEGGGRVLRYRGDSSDPLRWEEVGKLDTIGAGLTFHEGRIFVGTWPNITVALADPGVVRLPDILNGPRPGVFMGPIVPPRGLTGANFDDWVKVWETSDYEPDASTAATYGVGDIESFQGRLWWGTIHVPSLAFNFHSFLFERDLLNPPCSCSNIRCVRNPVPDPDCCILNPDTAPICEKINLARENTDRATILVRGSNFDGTPEIELLYGETSLPAYDSSTGEWEEKPNSMSAVPLFGGSGLDNTVNVYTWNMAVFDKKLYVGTLDITAVDEEEPENLPGADLFSFTDLSSEAESVSLDGLGNALNFGFRVLLPDEDGKNDDDALYIGTANPFNLAPEGGWELLRLK